jgi:hypothetical protein
MDVEEGEEIKTKGNDNLFNRIITENFPNLKKESHTGTYRILRKLTEHQNIMIKKETPPDTS